MRLSENYIVLKDRKKFTSPPLKKAENESKVRKMEDLTLMITVTYKV